ncbi:MAG: SIS domain-containing protein [Armatimonadetes bacterium]|nr:SIS domain-containing protein [Armatimonadota bacterium]
MSYMLDEIHEQPDVIRRLVREERERVEDIARKVRERNVSLGVLAARGTSDNAATYGKYLFEMVNGLPIALAAPSVFTLYHAKLRLDAALVIGISQSGQAADVIEYLERSRELGAITACITNEPQSGITRAAESCLLCHAWPEKSVAATKSYTASLALLCLLSAACLERSDLVDGLLRTADCIQRIFDCCEPEIAERAERYRYMDECIVLARGTNRATAFETALKIAETSYMSADPYSSVDFLHGPIAVVEEGLPCILFAPSGQSYRSMFEIAERLHSRGAELIVVSDTEEILELATTKFRLPFSLDDIFSPIAYITVGQLFSYYLAATKGLDPDNPRGLTKVTITR